jgi:hypothetical protein
MMQQLQKMEKKLSLLSVGQNRICYFSQPHHFYLFIYLIFQSCDVAKSQAKVMIIHP